MSESHNSHLHQKRLERFSDLTHRDSELSEEERDFVEDVFKELLACKKKKVSECEVLYRKETNHTHYSSECLKHCRKDVFCYCAEVIDLVNKRLLSHTKSPQGKVFFLKVKGDFVRYCAEHIKKCDPNYTAIIQEGLKAYMLGYEIARNELPCEDDVYLHLCLNFSVFYYAIIGDIRKACELISKTLNQLERNKDSICKEIWKSIQPIKCLLENNLLLWQAEYQEKRH